MPEQIVDALIEGGKATAAPPLGPALGPLGVNIGQIVADINKKTASFKGMQVPVKVIVNSETKEFKITVGTPPASALIKQEAKVQKASSNPGKEFVADLKIEQIIKIAKMKEDALTGKDLKAKVKEVIGTCNSMGIKVEEVPAVEAIKLVNDGKFDKKIKDEKTELTADELKHQEEERKAMKAELEEKHAKEDTAAKAIMAEMEGKDKKDIRSRMKVDGISDETIHRLVPADEVPAKGTAPAKEAAKPSK